MQQRGKRKVRKGRVVGDKMDKTAVVVVERRLPHPLYRKVVKMAKKFKADNPENNARRGDWVEIMETRPLSKDKRWRITRIIRKTKERELAAEEAAAAEMEK